MSKVEALIRVVVDGQAFLYAQHYKLMAEMLGKEVSDEDLEQWQDEWKVQTAELVGVLLDGGVMDEDE